VLSPEQQPLALPVSAEIGTPAPYTGPNVPPVPEMVENRQSQAEMPAWMNSARQLGASQAATMKTVGTLVQENPKQAALIVRDWLSSAT
jgi:flagellar M-ring protein FliF